MNSSAVIFHCIILVITETVQSTLNAFAKDLAASFDFL